MLEKPYIKPKNTRMRALVSGILSLLLAMGSLLTPYAIRASQARDFDTNAVMNGGAYSKEELLYKLDHGDGRNSAANLQQIYLNEGRGVTREGINQAVDGEIHKDGTAWVGGRQVANSVWSSGRIFLQNSQKDGSLWMRPPSVSFRSESLGAFVCTDNKGLFKWAIIKSCGNPIKLIGAPFGQIYKRVAVEGGEYQAADTSDTALDVNLGQNISYRITVTNNGTAVMNNVKVADILPAGVEVRSDSSRRDVSFDLGSIEAGGAKYYTVNAKVTSNECSKRIENKASFTADGGQKGEDSAWIHVVCLPPPPPPPPQDQKGHLKVYKFEDKNHNGTKDKGEPLLKGFKFKLNSGQEGITDENGVVVFSDLSLGQYVVTEIEIPSDWIATTANPQNAEVKCSQTTEIWFGNQYITPPQEEKGCIKIVKFEDVNHNGSQDKGESFLGGFKFKLSNGQEDSVDDNGMLVFCELDAGKYTVTEINIPEGWMVTTDNPKEVVVEDGKTTVVYFGNQKPSLPPPPPPPPPTPPTPSEQPPSGKGEQLPPTGPGSVAGFSFGLFGMGVSGLWYRRSRKELLDALKNF